MSSEVDKIAAYRNYDLYLLTGEEIPFVQDGKKIAISDVGGDVCHGRFDLRILSEHHAF